VIDPHHPARPVELRHPHRVVGLAVGATSRSRGSLSRRAIFRASRVPNPPFRNRRLVIGE
jgi:hypothetical protein